MATITITIPDAVSNRVMLAIAATYGWNASGGQTMAQFAKSHLIRHIKDIVKSRESETASETARLTALAAVDTDIVLT